MGPRNPVVKLSVMACCSGVADGDVGVALDSSHPDKK